MITLFEPNRFAKVVDAREKVYQYSDAGVREEILARWGKAVIRSENHAELLTICKHIMSHKDRYDAITIRTGVPWHVVACLSSMETGCNFTEHLHNGDPLSARTIQVPAGRPVAGKPPFTWEESAADALAYDHFIGVTDWSLEHTLWMFEKYNGTGYRARGLPSRYVWGYTNVEQAGRYVADKVWDPKSWGKQPGCAAILKGLIELGNTIGIKDVPPPAIPPVTVWVDLKKGSTGTRVKLLQARLNLAYGEKLTVDGDFGAVTEAAVKRAQHALALPEDGIVANNVWLMIDTFKIKRPEVITTPPDANLMLITEAKKYIGVHEVGGNNMGPEVQKFQKAVDKIANGEPWCMAFVQYCIIQVESQLNIKSKIKKSEHCLTTLRDSPGSMGLTKPAVGCVVIWQHGKTSNGHTGFVTGILPGGAFNTIEGNTDSDSGMNREGNGVFERIRHESGDGDMHVAGYLKVF